MDFFEIKLNDCFSSLYRINDIMNVTPNIRCKVSNGPEIENLIKSFEPYNNENSKVMSYNVKFKCGAIVTISCSDYEILKEKIKKLQEGVL